MRINSSGERIFHYINTILLSIMGFVAIAPLVAVVSTSFSSSSAVDLNKVSFWPVGFTLDSWKFIVFRQDLWKSFGLTVAVTFIGITLSLLITALFAYPLSKKEFKLGRIIMIAVVVTMVFKAPIIPYFLTVRGLGLYNNALVLILPHILTAYNLVIMRTFFRQIPAELEEAAIIEGCGYFQVLFRIIIPSSKAVLATLGLFYGVMLWNQFQHPLFFLQDPDLFPLQMKIRQYIVNNELSIDAPMADVNYNERTLKAATIVFAIVPIIMAYPYLQKYFVKGAMIGAVKG